MIEARELIDDLDRIAVKLDRLTVHHRDPERFFVERSDIVDELRRLIAECQGRVRGPVRPQTACPPPLFREAREADE